MSSFQNRLELTARFRLLEKMRIGLSNRINLGLIESVEGTRKLDTIFSLLRIVVSLVYTVMQRCA